MFYLLNGCKKTLNNAQSAKTQLKKNDGCFQMKCSQCGHYFCWLCRQDWSTHTDHFKCSKFNETNIQNKPEFRDGDNNNLISQNIDDTFLNYYGIIKQYEGNQKYEVDVRQKIDNLKVKAKELSGFTPDFLYDSLEQLSICRKLLINMFKRMSLTPPKLLEPKDHSLVGSLQMIVEKLTTMLEKDLNEEYIIKQTNWSLPIKKLTKIGKQFVENLLEENIIVTN